MKIILYFFITLLLSSCMTNKKITANMNSWIGSSKNELIMSQGLPLTTGSDGANGEVLVYGTQLNSTYGSTWEYAIYFTHADGIIYHWLVKREHTPPSQLDVNLFVQ